MQQCTGPNRTAVGGRPLRRVHATTTVASKGWRPFTVIAAVENGRSQGNAVAATERPPSVPGRSPGQGPGLDLVPRSSPSM